MVVPQLTKQQSDARVRELRRLGCKVWRVHTRQGTVVLKRCPKGVSDLSGVRPFHVDEAGKFLMKGQNLVTRAEFARSDGNCDEASRRLQRAIMMGAKAKAHVESIDVGQRPGYLGTSQGTLRRNIMKKLANLTRTCGREYEGRLVWDE